MHFFVSFARAVTVTIKRMSSALNDVGVDVVNDAFMRREVK